MNRRPGASLLNVMVFMLFAVMITAQVFFFSRTSMESLSEERELMSYRLMLDALVKEAKGALEKTGTVTIEHKDTTSLTFETFSDDARAYVGSGASRKLWEKSNKWNDTPYDVRIYDLDYTLNPAFSSRKDWSDFDKKMYGKIFAAMPFDPQKDAEGNIINDDEGKPRIEARYYLIRAWASLPNDNRFYGRKLMYQVLVRREEGTHNVGVKSFQEVWF